jgi:hypothetical protein
MVGSWGFCAVWVSSRPWRPRFRPVSGTQEHTVEINGPGPAVLLEFRNHQ